jgi:hypothetical protein
MEFVPLWAVVLSRATVPPYFIELASYIDFFNEERKVMEYGNIILPGCSQAHRWAMQFHPIRPRSPPRLGQKREGVSPWREERLGGKTLRIDVVNLTTGQKEDVKRKGKSGYL